MPQESELSILFWNIWGHRKPKELKRSLLQFKRHAVDIMCLTEVTHTTVADNKKQVVHTSLDRNEPPSRLNGLERLEEALEPEYNLTYETPSRDTWYCYKKKSYLQDVGFGSVLAWRRQIDILGKGFCPITPDPFAAKPRILQWAVIRKPDDLYLVAHLHGLWLPENSKGDDPLRSQQSQEVSSKLEQLRKTFGTSKVVFGGDFNLDINTEALELLKRGSGSVAPMRNLIEECNVGSTRTSLYRHWNNPEAVQHADHILVSPEIEVHSFSQPRDVLASDHTPLVVWVS